FRRVATSKYRGGSAHFNSLATRRAHCHRRVRSRRIFPRNSDQFWIYTHMNRLPPTYVTHDIVLLRTAALRFVRSNDTGTLHAVPAWSHLLRYDCTSPRPDSVLKFI